MTGLAKAKIYKSISRDIVQLSAELVPLVRAQAASIFQSKHQEKIYKAAVSHALRVNEIEKKYVCRVGVIAKQISDYAQHSWEQQPAVVQLWYALANVVTNFSEHPTKKVATLIISYDNKLQAFAANRVPAGVRKRANHYAPGLRKNYVVCSERMAFAKFLGLKLHDVKAASVSDQDQQALLRANIQAFSEAIIAAGNHTPDMQESFVLSTVTPCDTCIETINAFRPQAVFAHSRGHEGKGYTRDVSFDRAKQALGSAGIVLIDLAPQ